MTAVAVYVASVVATAAVLLAHQDQPSPLAGLWRAYRARWGVRAATHAPGASRGRTGRPVPSWAHTDHHDYDEAA